MAGVASEHCVTLCAGETISEGGFAKNKVSTAALLDVQKAKDSKGKTYYKYDILSRSGTRSRPYLLTALQHASQSLYINAYLRF